MRFLPHEIQQPGFIVRTAIEKIAIVEQWSSVISKSPYLYYNVDQFLPLITYVKACCHGRKQSATKLFGGIAQIKSR